MQDLLDQASATRWPQDLGDVSRPTPYPYPLVLGAHALWTEDASMSTWRGLVEVNSVCGRTTRLD